MNLFTLYRILTGIVNIFCIFIAITLVFGLFLVLGNPSFAFGFFMMLSVVLYGWFAYKFLRIFLNPDLPFTKKHKDWLKVNAIVTLIFSIMLITQSIAFISNPKRVEEAFAQMPVKSPADLIVNTSIVLLSFALVLLVHVIWTLVLVRQNQHLVDATLNNNNEE